MINVIPPSSRQDKFGFYQVGDLKFYSKLEALQVHKQLNKPVTWNFNELTYSGYNWEVEPVESLSELYKQRAQQLRDKYDYLVLWFSGGADSNNVLDVFINNDIKIDEVVSYVNYDATGDKNNWLNAEIYNIAVPKVEALKEKQPWLKHRLIDLSQLTVDAFTNKEAKFNWIYHANGYFNPNTIARHNIKLKVPEWTQMFDTGKKVGFIYGMDKPKVTGIKGKYYFKFLDMIDNAVTAETQMANNAWEFDELFYWSPDLPELVIKQAHIVKNFLKLQETHKLKETRLQYTHSQETIDKKLYELPTGMLHTLIYPTWKPIPFQGKAPNIFFSPRDTWFFNLPDSDPAKRAWKIGLEELWRSTPESFKHERNKLPRAIDTIYSKIYYIGE